MKCVRCGSELTGKRTKFCSNPCKNRHGVTEFRRRLKKRAVAYKGGKCVRCGYNRCVAAMIFHHPGKKSFGVASNKIRAWKTVRKELAKCELLCLNCHAEEHHFTR